MNNSFLNYTKELEDRFMGNEMLPQENQFNLSPKAIAKFLFIIILVLLVAHVVSLYLRYNLPESNRMVSLVNKYFSFNREGNFPAFFSSISLLIAAGILFLISKITINENSKTNRKFWWILGCIFLFLAFDEAVQIHDELVLTVRNRMPELPGIFYYAWVIPYSVLLLGVVIYFMRFVLSLPENTRNLFFLSGFLYVGGAIGFELIEGYVEKHYGRVPVYYHLLITIEELLEMVGVVIFIYALLDYLMRHKAKLLVKFTTRH